MDFSGARVLITGGAGFIGSTLAHRLVNLGAQVTIADSFIPEYGGSPANLEGIEKKISLSVTDVRDPHAMRYLVQGQDFLFNLAGQTSHMDSMADPFTDLEINAKAQLSILESCRTNNPRVKIVFAGTRQIYGRPDYLPVDEEHPIRPVDINGIHKVAGEWYHMLYNNVYGLRSTVLRLTNTYGPRMRIKDARQTFVGIWIRLILEGKIFEVWGGEQLRDFTYVEDCVEALLLTASDQADGKVYNLGGDKVVSLRELADALIAASNCGQYALKDFPEDRKKIDIGDYYSQDARIRKELGWHPVVSLEEGLSRTLAYFAPRLEKYL
ncbi:NAD-dependent epimerase/dehydratase family protein [Nitratidesulfovibrio sp. SRB-5]|uniref:NAD-dependent epimerase/dehydratase family protein n=1 Tax=Nitratidesulfovibrio sp. SRB-5 TaxID=2872636 RepID=UPI001024B239|nr:NAD-dependent epimerase/dehydratase family protein [Nitratidesulfovibrio sp. SRB-5]MBZ2170882.1 NAD-dependent epimerase/dehydratase family protein [Nitratidesulfovibrio sp. SRB-5]RXF78121.1 NAD-dependent epimerase/dehydratase family protein [Desulfovibrio sp. DS-1]